MRLLHVPFTYFPSTCGGTEVYVAALCRELAAEGVTNVIAAPDTSASRYSHLGIEVHRFATDPAPSFETLNGGGDPEAADALGRVMDETKPDLIHFHARSPAVSHLALRQSRRRGIPSIYTYHTPTASCNRGSLMRWGKEPCDGLLNAPLCAACQLHGLGIPRPLAQMFTAMSPLTRHVSGLLPGLARWQLPARALPVATMRHGFTREWFQEMDRIVALNAWTERLLRLNGIPGSKIRKVRHGLAQERLSNMERHGVQAKTGGPLRLVFLGRLDPMKGLGVLLNALALVPDADVELDIYAIISQSPNSGGELLRQRIASDRRIRICAPVPPEQAVGTLQSYDALLVPSQWMETGPLVVLESFAAGVPVLGSDLGGIAEWVTHEHDGLLLAHDSPEVWSKAIQRIADEPGVLSRFRSNIQPPRSMREVAMDMLGIYQELQTAQ